MSEIKKRGDQVVSRWGLLCTILGMAVGTGNIWRFPREVVKINAGAFIIACFIAIFLWAVPVITAECTFGKKTRMANAGAFSSVYVWSDVWQHLGWDSIIYIAALSSVDPTLYEAATIDGASRWHKLIHIDFPMILPTAGILLIMRLGSVLGVGFEKVYLMQNTLNLDTSEVIATYVYKMGLLSSQYSFSAAVGLFNTLVNFILLVIVNRISSKISDNTLF